MEAPVCNCTAHKPSLGTLTRQERGLGNWEGTNLAWDCRESSQTRFRAKKWPNKEVGLMGWSEERRKSGWDPLWGRGWQMDRGKERGTAGLCC